LEVVIWNLQLAARWVFIPVRTIEIVADILKEK